MKDITQYAYKAQPIDSRTSPWDTESQDFFERVAQEIPNGEAIIWMYHRITPLSIKGGVWSREDLPAIDHIVRMRAFNEQSEIHVWRSRNQLQGRLRTDTPGQTTKVVDTGQYLLPSIRKLWKDRDCEQIVTRNYIGHNGTGQAGYIDSRFVKLH
jgi:hypothetical protein